MGEASWRPRCLPYGSNNRRSGLRYFWVFAEGDYEFLEPMGSDINAPGVSVGLLACYNKSTGRGARAPTLLEQMVWSVREKLLDP